MKKKIILSFILCAGSFLSAMESLSKKKDVETTDFKKNKIWIVNQDSLPNSVKTLITTGKAYCKDLEEIRKNLSFRFVQATDPYVQNIIFVSPETYNKDQDKGDNRKAYSYHNDALYLLQLYDGVRTQDKCSDSKKEEYILTGVFTAKLLTDHVNHRGIDTGNTNLVPFLLDRTKTVMDRGKRTLNPWEKEAISLTLKKSFEAKSLETVMTIKKSFEEVWTKDTDERLTALKEELERNKKIAGDKSNLRDQYSKLLESISYDDHGSTIKVSVLREKLKNQKNIEGQKNIDGLIEKIKEEFSNDYRFD